MKNAAPENYLGSDTDHFFQKIEMSISNQQNFMKKIFETLIDSNPQNSNFTNNITEIYKEYNQTIDSEQIKFSESDKTFIQNFKDQTEKNLTSMKIDVGRLNETMTQLSASITALRDEFELVKTRYITSPHKNLSDIRARDDEIKKIRSEIEAFKSAIDVIHDNAASQEELHECTKEVQKIQEAQIEQSNKFQKSGDDISISLNNFKNEQNQFNQKIENQLTAQDIRQDFQAFKSIQDTLHDKIEQELNSLKEHPDLLQLAEQMKNEILNDDIKLQLADIKSQLNDRMDKIDNDYSQFTNQSAENNSIFDDIKEQIRAISLSQQRLIENENAQTTVIRSLQDTQNKQGSQISQLLDTHEKFDNIQLELSSQNQANATDSPISSTSEDIPRRVYELERKVSRLVSQNEVKKKLTPLDIYNSDEIDNESTETTLKRHNKEIAVLSKNFIVLQNEVADDHASIDEFKERLNSTETPTTLNQLPSNNSNIHSTNELNTDQTNESNTTQTNESNATQTNGPNTNQTNESNTTQTNESNTNQTNESNADETNELNDADHSNNDEVEPHVDMNNSDIDQIEREIELSSSNLQQSLDADKSISDDFAVLRERVDQITAAYSTMFDMNKALISHVKQHDSIISKLQANQKHKKEVDSEILMNAIDNSAHEEIDLLKSIMEEQKQHTGTTLNCIKHELKKLIILHKKEAEEKEKEEQYYAQRKFDKDTFKQINRNFNQEPKSYENAGLPELRESLTDTDAHIQTLQRAVLELQHFYTEQTDPVEEFREKLAKFEELTNSVLSNQESIINTNTEHTDKIRDQQEQLDSQATDIKALQDEIAQTKEILETLNKPAPEVNEKENSEENVQEREIDINENENQDKDKETPAVDMTAIMEIVNRIDENYLSVQKAQIDLMSMNRQHTLQLTKLEEDVQALQSPDLDAIREHLTNLDSKAHIIINNVNAQTSYIKEHQRRITELENRPIPSLGRSNDVNITERDISIDEADGFDEIDKINDQIESLTQSNMKLAHSMTCVKYELKKIMKLVNETEPEDLQYQFKQQQLSESMLHNSFDNADLPELREGLNGIDYKMRIIERSVLELQHNFTDKMKPAMELKESLQKHENGNTESFENISEQLNDIKENVNTLAKSQVELIDTTNSQTERILEHQKEINKQIAAMKLFKEQLESVSPTVIQERSINIDNELRQEIDQLKEQVADLSASNINNTEHDLSAISASLSPDALAVLKTIDDDYRQLRLRQLDLMNLNQEHERHLNKLDESVNKIDTFEPIINELTERTAALIDANDKKDEALQYTIRCLKYEIKQMKEQLSLIQLNDKTDQLSTEIENIKSQLSTETENIKSQLSTETENIRSQLSTENESIKYQLRCVKYEVKRMKEQLSFIELNDKTDQLSTEIENIKSQLLTETENIKSQLSTETENIKSQLSTKTENIKSQLSAETENIKSQLSTETENIKSQLSTETENSKYQLRCVKYELKKLKEQQSLINANTREVPVIDKPEEEDNEEIFANYQDADVPALREGMTKLDSTTRTLEKSVLALQTFYAERFKPVEELNEKFNNAITELQQKVVDIGVNLNELANSQREVIETTNLQTERLMRHQEMINKQTSALHEMSKQIPKEPIVERDINLIEENANLKQLAYDVQCLKYEVKKLKQPNNNAINPQLKHNEESQKLEALAESHDLAGINNQLPPKVLAALKEIDDDYRALRLAQIALMNLNQDHAHAIEKIESTLSNLNSDEFNRINDEFNELTDRTRMIIDTVNKQTEYIKLHQHRLNIIDPNGTRTPIDSQTKERGITLNADDDYDNIEAANDTIEMPPPGTSVNDQLLIIFQKLLSQQALSKKRSKRISNIEKNLRELKKSINSPILEDEEHPKESNETAANYQLDENPIGDIKLLKREISAIKQRNYNLDQLEEHLSAIEESQNIIIKNANAQNSVISKQQTQISRFEAELTRLNNKFILIDNNTDIQNVDDVKENVSDLYGQIESLQKMLADLAQRFDTHQSKSSQEREINLDQDSNGIEFGQYAKLIEKVTELDSKVNEGLSGYLDREKEIINRVNSYHSSISTSLNDLIKSNNQIVKTVNEHEAIINELKEGKLNSGDSQEIEDIKNKIKEIEQNYSDDKFEEMKKEFISMDDLESIKNDIITELDSISKDDFLRLRTEVKSLKASMKEQDNTEIISKLHSKVQKVVTAHQKMVQYVEKLNKDVNALKGNEEQSQQLRAFFESVKDTINQHSETIKEHEMKLSSNKELTNESNQIQSEMIEEQILKVQQSITECQRSIKLLNSKVENVKNSNEEMIAALEEDRNNAEQITKTLNFHSKVISKHDEAIKAIRHSKDKKQQSSFINNEDGDIRLQ